MWGQWGLCPGRLVQAAAVGARRGRTETRFPGSPYPTSLPCPWPRPRMTANHSQRQMPRWGRTGALMVRALWKGGCSASPVCPPLLTTKPVSPSTRSWAGAEPMSDTHTCRCGDPGACPLWASARRSFREQARGPAVQHPPTRLALSQPQSQSRLQDILHRAARVLTAARHSLVTRTRLGWTLSGLRWAGWDRVPNLSRTSPGWPLSNGGGRPTEVGLGSWWSPLGAALPRKLSPFVGPLPAARDHGCRQEPWAHPSSAPTNISESSRASSDHSARRIPPHPPMTTDESPTCSCSEGGVPCSLSAQVQSGHAVATGKLGLVKAPSL